MNGHGGVSRDGSSGSPDSCSGGDLDDDDLSVNGCCVSPNINQNIPCIRSGNVIQHYSSGSQGGDADVVLSDNFKQLNMVPYMGHQHVNQQQMKKDEVMQPVKVGAPPPPQYEVSLPPQSIPQRPNPYQQVQYQPPHAYYDMSRDNNGADPPPPQQQQQQQQQHTMYLPTNQQAYVANGHVYPQQPPVHHHQVFSYQGEYQHHYPTMGFPNQPFPHHNYMRTAIARGTESNSDLLKSNTTSELSLSIPSCKETKEDSWKFGGSNKSSSTLNRIDSCLDSGRGSSMGYSSDTFSPLSSASAGSRGSPQSVQDSESTRKIWDDKNIWAAPADSSKLSTWSNNRPSSNGWNFFLDNRLSDPEEQNTSSESVGKCHEGSVLEKQSSYSSMKEWPRSTDSRLNGESQGLLGLFPTGSPATKRPPPGFGLK
jgi:hypothetical protein